MDKWASAQVKSMFNSIAHRYDLTNDVLSCGVHHLWRNYLLKKMHHSQSTIDLATGTGALIPYLLKKSARVVGVDFSDKMLAFAPAHITNDTRVTLLCADALDLPFDSGNFDCATVAFGVRNFADLERGLIEIKRVVQKGGQILILEFGQIENRPFRHVYNWYSKTIMPRVGGWLTGNEAAYEYLPQTAARFPCGEKFIEHLHDCGLDQARYWPLWGGMAYLYDITV
jgi:demethylmenaquinone methyltransferase/2-methoxy-6-polyprenyl-1,4-benzoquinol methylase